MTGFLLVRVAFLCVYLAAVGMVGRLLLYVH